MYTCVAENTVVVWQNTREHVPHTYSSIARSSCLFGGFAWKVCSGILVRQVCLAVCYLLGMFFVEICLVGFVCHICLVGLLDRFRLLDFFDSFV